MLADHAVLGTRCPRWPRPPAPRWPRCSRTTAFHAEPAGHHRGGGPSTGYLRCSQGMSADPSVGEVAVIAACPGSATAGRGRARCSPTRSGGPGQDPRWSARAGDAAITTYTPRGDGAVASVMRSRPASRRRPAQHRLVVAGDVNVGLVAPPLAAQASASPGLLVERSRILGLFRLWRAGVQHGEVGLFRLLHPGRQAVGEWIAWVLGKTRPLPGAGPGVGLRPRWQLDRRNAKNKHPRRRPDDRRTVRRLPGLPIRQRRMAGRMG